MTEVNTDWQEKVLDGFLGGLDTSAHQDRIGDNNLSSVQNLIIDQHVLATDWGYSTFLGAVIGIPRAIVQFKKKSGATTLCLITNTRFYVKASGEWQYVSSGTATTCTDGEPAGEVNIVVGSISGFSDGDPVGIILDNGTQHRTTINGAPSGSTIVIDDGIPVGRTVSVGAALIQATELTGTNSDAVSFEVVASHDWLVFTNNTDNVQRFDGSDLSDIPNLPSGGNCKAKVVRVVTNHLVLFNTTEGGTAYPQRVRNADTGDPTNWSTGNASYEDLFKDEHHITAVERIGPYTIIYKSLSITRMEYVGSDDILFNFEQTVSGEGCISVNGVLRVRDYHIVFGQTNIYEYRGGFDYTPIGDTIYEFLLGASGELNPAAQGLVFCEFSEELNEVWIFYPSGSNTEPDAMLRYSLRHKAWYYRKFIHSFMMAGQYVTSDSKTWLELEGDWTEQDWNWNSQTLSDNAPLILLCAASPNQVYAYDYLSITDSGTDIDWEMHTKEFIHSQYNIRMDSIVLNAKGAATVEYSTDGGYTWAVYGIKGAGSNWEMARIFKQLTCRSIIFKLSGTGPAAVSRMILNFRLEDIQ